MSWTEMSAGIRRGAAAACVTAAAVLSGCGGQESETLIRNAVQIGKSVQDRPIELATFGNGEDKTLIIATIHGNEAAGTPIVLRLAELLRSRPDLLTGRKVGIVPVVNPDGFEYNIRTNARGVDLNRNFEATNRENSARYGMSALSEPESRVIKKLLEDFKPTRIVTIHQPLKTVDWEGPGEDLARFMAKYCDLPADPLGTRPGSLGAYAGDDQGIPIITLELPKEATGKTQDELWEKYGRCVIAAITYPQEVPMSVIGRGGEAAIATILGLGIVIGLLALMAYDSRRKLSLS